MNAKKHPPVVPFDPSLNPTRKVESMSSIAAELLLRAQEGEFEQPTGRRLRSDRPPALDAFGSEAGAQPGHAWRTNAPAPSLAGHAPSARTQAPWRVAVLVGGALLLVALSVTATLLLTR